MYLPKKQVLSGRDRITEFVAKFGFGVLISSDLEASHMPFLLLDDQREAGSGLRLAGHFAKANPHWQSLNGCEVLVVFTGPHAYISPTWYSAAPNVPTWNYASVHMRGILRFTDERETVNIVEGLMQQYEPALIHDRTIVTAEYQQRLLAAIVGFEIVVNKVEGREKLGQHRSHADQVGVYQALSSSVRSDARELAAYMRSCGIGIGMGIGIDADTGAC
jgi:transcriptional regulator